MIEYLHLSIKNLTNQKSRTFLTLLGVIIGITAVVAMVSIGTGMRMALDEQVKTLGSDKIIIQPKQLLGGTSTKGLTEADSDAVEKIVGINFVSPMYNVVSNVKFKGEDKTVTIWGLSPEKAERTFAGVSGFKLFQGRWLRGGDRGKIAIGFGIHDDFFDRSVNVGNNIIINDKRFEVIGIFSKTGDRDNDYTVYADIDQTREFLEKTDEVSVIVARVKEGYNVDKIGYMIQVVLEKRHNENDFTVLTPSQLADQVGQTFKIVQIVFGGIAAISLLVGGIGIANTMIMNVLERTQEVGIMKAIGASNKQVITAFLFESGVIGIVGGSIGVIFGFIISKGINLAASRYLGEGILTAYVSPQMAIFAITFSLGMGIISGLYPAYRASKLDPIIALRE
jgi:putative ABC transport system permease protein|tara:strand:- start:14908 stop:16092 length:1185 start_codon:yes stop_codon:yes gene_type:complete